MHIMALSMEIASASSRTVSTKNAASHAFEAYGEGIRDVEKKPCKNSINTKVDRVLVTKAKKMCGKI